jgi:hypothetical protein
MKPQYTSAANLQAFQAAGGRVPKNLLFAPVGDNYVGYEEVNGTPGYQVGEDYMQYVNGYGQKYLTRKQIEDFPAWGNALAANGWNRKKASHNVNSIIANLIRPSWVQLPPDVRKVYTMLRAIQDVNADIKQQHLQEFFNTYGLPPPQGTPDQQAKFLKKVFSSAEWKAAIPDWIGKTSADIQRLTTFLGERAAVVMGGEPGE